MSTHTNKERVLTIRIAECVSDWGDDFSICLEQYDSESDGTIVYFSVVLAHKFLGRGCEFRARVKDDDICEIEYGDDSWWYPLNMGYLFAGMWFDTASVR